MSRGQVIRTERTRLGWSQKEFGARMSCAASTVSRWETGAADRLDLATLRRIAVVLGIAPERLGVAATVAGDQTAGARDDEEVRRRRLLTLAATAAAAAVPPAHGLRGSGSRDGGDRPGTGLAARIGDALLGTGAGLITVAPDRMRPALAAAIADYDASRFGRLEHGLPRLVHSVQMAVSAADLAAETYILTTRVLTKLGDELAWVAADRAVLSARLSGRPLLVAEAARVQAVLARRAGRFTQATDLVMAAADGEVLRGHASALVAERGLLVMSAAYTAAHAGDRAGMRELTAQADALAREAGGGVLLRDHGGGFGPGAVALHRISAEYTAGDPSAAVAAARRIAPARLPTVERQARYWVDVARAYAMWGRREETLSALLRAERAAPEETRARPAAQALVWGLLAQGRTLPGLRELAFRCGLR
nr:helix-turn-helix transcriptional regulator [Actinomadura rayongensis]